jgi:hypothetical protein
VYILSVFTQKPNHLGKLVCMRRARYLMSLVGGGGVVGARLP